MGVVVDPNVLRSTLIAPKGASDKAVRALPTGATLIVSEKLLAWPARSWLIQNITTPDDAWLPDRQVRDPLTAFAQVEIIEQA